MRHLVALSKALLQTTLGADGEARRTILYGNSPSFLLHRLAGRFGLPVLPEWAEWSEIPEAPAVSSPATRHHGIVKRWQEARCAAVVAECGTGKTLISLGSIFTHASGTPFTALAMVPPQLVFKWAREVFQTLPGVRVFLVDGCRNGIASNGFKGVNEVRLRNGRVVREGVTTTLSEIRLAKNHHSAKTRWRRCALKDFLAPGKP